MNTTTLIFLFNVRLWGANERLKRMARSRGVITLIGVIPYSLPFSHRRLASMLCRWKATLAVPFVRSM